MSAWPTGARGDRHARDGASSYSWRPPRATLRPGCSRSWPAAPTWRRTARSSKGLSLLELLVALLPALTATAMLAGFARIEGRLLASAVREVALHESLRRVAAAVTAEVRVAAGPGGDGAGALVGAEPGRIEIATVDASGAAGPTLAFFRDRRSGNLAQRVGAQTTPLTDEILVDRDGLRFRYLDACGGELSPDPSGGLSDGDRARVRAITVRIAARLEAATLTARSSATIRSRRGLVCEAPPP